MPFQRYAADSTYLPLSLPALQIWSTYPATDFNMLPLSNEHVGGRRDVGNGRLSRVESWDPVRNGNVVGGAPVSHRDGTLQNKKQLRSPIVVSCCKYKSAQSSPSHPCGRRMPCGVEAIHSTVYFRLRRERRDSNQGAVHVNIDPVRLSILSLNLTN